MFAVMVALPSMSFASFDTSLKYGSKGATVIELQDFLQDQGYYTLKIDGRFGLGTLRSVKLFQTANGLKADGYFGALSRAKAGVILATILEESDETELSETGTITPLPLTPFNPTNGQIPTPTTPPTTPVTPPASTPVVDPLTFTQRPKIFYKDVDSRPDFEDYRLSYITFETNRPSRIVGGPVIQDATGWTTAQGAGDSCGGGTLVPYSSTICKITAQDASGVKAEISISIHDDIALLAY